MAAEELGGIDPFVVVLDSLGPLGVVFVAEGSFAVTHDEQHLHAQVVGPLLELGEVLFVLGLVLEKLVDELDGFDAVVLFRRFGEVEIVELLSEQGFVEGPLGERDLEERLSGLRFFLRENLRTRQGRKSCRSRGSLEKRSTGG